MRRTPGFDRLLRQRCELYLVRHAIAAERSEEWPDDGNRPLTARGVARFRQSVAGFASMHVALDEIFTSPLVRARQTAELLAEGLPGKPAVKVLAALAPAHTPVTVLRELAQAARGQRLALVGHEPGLGELAARLTGSSRSIPFKKGGICRIDLPGLGSRRPGELQWLLTPRMLRALGAC